tara:strand:- start:26 stop:295 length:270 start_codon:yes stop_codon:yes gene_type:complete
MPQMNFDLEDGQEPVSFLLSSADSERFMAFMADCTDAIKRRDELIEDRDRLRRNRDMYKDQSARQAKELHALRIDNRDLRREVAAWRGA